MGGEWVLVLRRRGHLESMAPYCCLMYRSVGADIKDNGYIWTLRGCPQGAGTDRYPQFQHQEIEDGKTMQTLDIYSKKIGRKYIIHSSIVTV